MTFAQLALISAVALLGPIFSLTRAFRVPVVIGELAVGVALGATGFGLLRAADPTFTFLADIGFALVMFVAGSHVPVRDPALRKGLRVGALRAVAIGVLAVPVGLLLASAFGTGHGPPYAVLLTSSSAGLILPTLAGLPLTAPNILTMLPQVAIADAACIVLLPLAIDPSHAGRAALGALAVGAAAVVLWWMLRWAHRSGAQRRVHEVSEERDLAIELRSLLVGLFGLAAIATALHVSIMLAGFALGLAVAAIGEPRRVAQQLFALTEGFFAPIFFVWLGASINLRELVSHPGAIGLGVSLGFAAVLVHGLMVLTKQPWAIALTTSAQLGVPVAAATIGTSLGLLQAGEPAAILLGALVTIGAAVALSGPVARIARTATVAPPT